MPPTAFPFIPLFENMFRKTNAKFDIIAPINPNNRTNHHNQQTPKLLFKKSARNMKPKRMKVRLKPLLWKDDYRCTKPNVQWD